MMPPNTFQRSTFPEMGALRSAVTAIIGNQFLLVCELHDDGSKAVRIDKATTWTAQQITDVQAAVTNAPGSAPVISPDSFTLVEKAIILALIDQFNVIRSKLVPPLADVTPAQALTAIRNKAGTL